MTTQGARIPTESASAQDVPQRLAQRGAARPRFRLQFTAAERKLLLILGDLLAMNGALLIAIGTWTEFAITPLGVLDSAKWYVTLTVLWLVIANILDVYNLARAASTTSTVSNGGIAALLTALAYVFVPWLTPQITNRSYVFGFVILGVTGVVCWRILYARALAQPNFWRRALILGTGRSACALARELGHGEHSRSANPFRGTGYEVVGLISGETAAGSEVGDGILVLGSVNQLVGVVRHYGVDEVVVAAENGEALTSEIYEVLLDCRELGLQVSSVESIYERLTARLPVDYARHDPSIILNSFDSAGARLYLAAKRLLDIAWAVIGLALLVVVTPVVAIGNACFAPGPLFYWQERVGKGGSPFKVVKYRSMRVDAEDMTGAVWAGDHDPRVTPVGHWLRRLRIDELPQAINVFRGEMSVVGPRPERPQFVGELARQMPLYRARHAVKPGITGWAQIHYGYGSSVEDARIKLEYDLYYVKHASLGLDLLTILQTIAVMVQFRGK